MKQNVRTLTAILIAAFAVSGSVSLAQTRDTGKLMEYENPFYKTIEKSIAEFEKEKEEPKLKFKMDFTGHDLPRSKDEFTQIWHNNVPLDDFMHTLKQAVKDGYSLFIGGDVSESGYFSFKDVAMVPSYDIPSAYIDENARQFRFSNQTTTDDHAIHIVGYLEKDNGTWFLIKDSGSGARNGANPGYYFYHEDYIKLKMMYFVAHKSAVKGLLNRMTK